MWASQRCFSIMVHKLLISGDLNTCVQAQIYSQSLCGFSVQNPTLRIFTFIFKEKRKAEAFGNSWECSKTNNWWAWTWKPALCLYLCLEERGFLSCVDTVISFVQKRINILGKLFKKKITLALSKKCTLFPFQISHFCYAWRLLPFNTLIETVIIDATFTDLFPVEIVYTESQIQKIRKAFWSWASLFESLWW